MLCNMTCIAADRSQVHIPCVAARCRNRPAVSTDCLPKNRRDKRAMALPGPTIMATIAAFQVLAPRGRHELGYAAAPERHCADFTIR